MRWKVVLSREGNGLWIGVASGVRWSEAGGWLKSV